MKQSIDDTADARLTYRMSCTGDPCEELPRDDDHSWIDADIESPYRSPSIQRT